VFGALGHFVQFFLAHHVDGGLDQIAHHGFHVAADVADFGVFRGFHLDERAAGQAREAPRDFRFPTPVGPIIRIFFGRTSSAISGVSFWRRTRLRNATATARFAAACPDDVFVQLDDNFSRSQLVKRRLGAGSGSCCSPGR
jgi:hypothetical protein